MKQKISYNSVISGLSIAFFIIFIAIFVLFWVFINKPFDNVFFWILVGLFALCFCWVLGSTPSEVYTDDDYVREKRPFNTKKYRFSDIKSAEPADRDNGVHLRGKFKNPVLITLKDGTQFIIGSEDAKQLSDYINSRLS